MKFMNMRSTLISAVMASLIIIGGMFSLVGCDNNNSSNVGDMDMAIKVYGNQKKGVTI